MTRSRKARLPFFLVALAVMSTVGCGGGGSGLDDDDEEVNGPEIPGDPEAGNVAAVLITSELDRILWSRIIPGGGAGGCVTADPFPWEDSDQDGVPDQVTFTHDLEACKTFLDNGAWVSNSGDIVATDPGEAFGVDISYNTFKFWEYVTQQNPAQTIVASHSGTVHLAGTGTQVSVVLDKNVLYQVTGEPDAAMTEQWSGTFVIDGEGPYGFNGGPGALTLSGPSTFTRNDVTIQFSLETVTPLSWDASCSAPWPSGGVVRAHVVSGGPNGYLEVKYNECWKMGEVEFIEP